MTETRVLVFTFCGFSNFTAADWEALNASDYGEQGLEMLPLGRRVAVDQGTYEVWEVVTGEEVEWLVLPLSGGCLYAFSLYAQMSDGELLDEFVSFLGTVTLTGE